MVWGVVKYGIDPEAGPSRDTPHNSRGTRLLAQLRTALTTNQQRRSGTWATLLTILLYRQTTLPQKLEQHLPARAAASPVIMGSVVAFHLETRWHFDQVISRKDERRVVIGFEGN